MTLPVLVDLGQITLDGLALGAYDDGAVWRSVDDVKGWYDSPAPRTGYTPRPFAAGSYYAPAYADTRTVVLTGRLAAVDLPTFVAAKRQLAGLCTDPTRLVELRVDDAAGTTRIMVQRSAETLFSAQGTLAADFSISCVAPDPRLLGDARSVTTQMAQSSGLGVPWRGAGGKAGIQWRGAPASASRGVLWRTGGQLVAGVLSLDNTAGTADADIVFTIRGPAQTPSLNTATAQITYGGSLGVGDVLVLDTGAGSVQLNGGNRRPYLTSADWFTVPPGAVQDVTFTAAVQNAQATATADFNVSYW